MTGIEMYQDVKATCETLGVPVYHFLQEQKESNPHITLYNVSTTPRYSLTCPGARYDIELVQVDAWAHTPLTTRDLGDRARAALEAVGYQVTDARSLNEGEWWRRVMTIRRLI